MYWAPAKMLLLANVDEYSFANTVVPNWHQVIYWTSDDLMPLRAWKWMKITHNLDNFSKKAAISNYIKIINFIINELIEHLYILTWWCHMAQKVMVFTGSGNIPTFAITTTSPRGQRVNTLRPRQNGRYFLDDIFKGIFLNENAWISLKISLKFVPKVRINNIPSLVQIMAWRRPGDNPLSEPMMVILLTHICVTRPQWVNTTIMGRNHSASCICNDPAINTPLCY